MKRTLVAIILGLTAGISAYGQPGAVVLFNTYSGVTSPAAFAWSTDPALAPPGLAGHQVGAESQYFNATLWFGVGASPTSWYQALVLLSTVPISAPLVDYSAYGEGGGWIFPTSSPVAIVSDVSGLPVYTPGPYTFRFVVTGSGPYQGAGGTFQFTEPFIFGPGGPPFDFRSLPTGPPYAAGGGAGLMQVITIPEPSAIALTAAGVITFLLRRNPSKN
jgi:hypothetical protein